MDSHMSAQILLASIKSLEVNNVDDDTLENIKKSLDIIIENDAFNGLIQQEAFCKLTDIQDVISARTAKVLERDKKILEEAASTIESDEQEGFTVGENNENDQLIRLMIRAEKDGNLTFEFRGIIWSWNHALSAWDFTTPKK